MSSIISGCVAGASSGTIFQPINLYTCHCFQVEEGASLVFDAAGADFYQLWVAEVLPTYSRGQDAGSLLKYRAHFDCDGCRQGTSVCSHACLSQ